MASTSAGSTSRRTASGETGSVVRGHREVCAEAAFGKEDSGVGFPDRAQIVRRLEGGKLAADVGRGEHFVRQPVQLGTVLGAAEDIAAGSPDHQAAGLPKE